MLQGVKRVLGKHKTGIGKTVLPGNVRASELGRDSRGRRSASEGRGHHTRGDREAQTQTDTNAREEGPYEWSMRQFLQQGSLMKSSAVLGFFLVLKLQANEPGLIHRIVKLMKCFGCHWIRAQGIRSLMKSRYEISETVNVQDQHLFLSLTLGIRPINLKDSELMARVYSRQINDR